MMYLPDTNVWIRHLNQASSIVKAKLAAYPPSQIALCDIVEAELYYGAYKSARIKPLEFSGKYAPISLEKVRPSALTICR